MAKKGDVNWAAVRERAKKIQEQPPREESNRDDKESKFFKMVDPGPYRFRILPTGNFVSNLPFKVIVRHELPFITETGYDSAIYVFCWHFIANEKEEIGKPLAKAGKLTRADTNKYREFGCPICSVRKEMYRADLKKAADRLGPREKYIWNALSRKLIDDGNGNKIPDPKVYVYSVSKTVGETIVGIIDENWEDGKNILDLKKGYDFKITATGPNTIERRYKSPMFTSVAKPAIDGDLSSIVVNDLTEISFQNFKNFQETIDALHKSMGKILAKNGISIPGDESSWNSNSLKEDDGDLFDEDEDQEDEEQIAEDREEAQYAADEDEEDEEDEYEPPARRPLRKGAKVKAAAKGSRVVKPGVKRTRRREIGKGQTGVKVGKAKVMDNSLDDDDDIPF